MSKTKDVRVMGNQYGTWIEVSGDLLLKICRAIGVDITNRTPDDEDAIKRFIEEAIDAKIRTVEAERPSMVGP